MFRPCKAQYRENDQTDVERRVERCFLCAETVVGADEREAVLNEMLAVQSRHLKVICRADENLPVGRRVHGCLLGIPESIRKDDNIEVQADVRSHVFAGARWSDELMHVVRRFSGCRSTTKKYRRSKNARAGVERRKNSCSASLANRPALVSTLAGNLFL